MTGNNKIIHQEHINKEQMMQQGKKRKAQDKVTTDIELQKLVEKLDRVSTVVCDGCASSNKSAKTID